MTSDHKMAKCAETPTLRSETELWLLGKNISELPPSRIPTKGDVLRYFCYLKDGPMKHEKFINFNSAIADKMCAEVQLQWTKAGIESQRKDKVKAKILDLYESYRVIKKHKGRKSNEKKEQSFVDDMKNYFFVAHRDAEHKIETDRFRLPSQKNEDIQFLTALKVGKKVLFGTEDKKYSKKVNNKLERESLESARQKVEDQRKKDLNKNAEESDNDHTLDSLENNPDPDTDFEIPSCSGYGPPKRPAKVPLELPRNPLKTARIAQMADRLKLSSAQSTAFVAAIVSEGGGDIDKMTLSKRSTRRAGQKVRKEIAEEIKASFIPPQHSVMHWDGKIIPGDHERLAILISGIPDYKEGKLLGIPMIDDGTGLTQANSCISVLHEWKVAPTVVGMSFDTTASNSGWMNGACVIAEKILDRKLFYFACRHHIYERILCSVWRVLFGETSSPDTPEFKDFKNSWHKITDHNTNFKTLEIRNRKLQLRSNDVTTFLYEQLTNANTNDSLPRDDYRECAELMIILLGGVPPRGLHWLKPGAYHHARWMPTIIYSAKMFAFGHLLQFDPEKMKKLERLCIFNTLYYIKPWLMASHGVDAPITDLQLWHDLKEYHAIDPEVSDAAVSAMERHFWYITEELAPFSLFSNQVSEAEKRKIACQLRKVKPSHSELLELGVPVFPTLNSSSKLVSLIGPKSWLLFQTLGFSSDWLTKPPSQWEGDTAYQEIAKFARHVKVVNDLSERAVKLIQDYAHNITKNEVQRQYLLQVVEQHRRLIPDFKKQTLKNV